MVLYQRIRTLMIASEKIKGILGTIVMTMSPQRIWKLDCGGL